MEFKLKLCFQNDLIRFIGDKLDKISKFILVDDQIDFRILTLKQ
jgi:hypothetical protein